MPACCVYLSLERCLHLYSVWVYPDRQVSRKQDTFGPRQVPCITVLILLSGMQVVGTVVSEPRAPPQRPFVPTRHS